MAIIGGIPHFQTYPYASRFYTQLAGRGASLSTVSSTFWNFFGQFGARGLAALPPYFQHLIAHMEIPATVGMEGLQMFQI